MGLEIISQTAKENQLIGEDWEAIIFNNGKVLCSSYSSGNVKVWSADLKPLKEFEAHSFPIYDMTSGHLQTFYTSSSDCTIKHWEDKEDSFVLLGTLEGHQEPPSRLRYVPDNSDSSKGRLYSGDGMGKVIIWEDDKLLWMFDTLEEIWDMVVHQEMVVTCRHLDICINTVAEKDRKFRHAIKNTFAGKGPLLIVNEKLFFVDRNNFDIHCNSLQTGNAQIGTFTGHTGLINGLAINFDSQILYSGGGDNKLIAWDLVNLNQLGELVVPFCINKICINPSNSVIYLAGQNKCIFSVKLM